MLPSQRHSLRVIQITLCRYSSHTTTHEASTLPQSTSPVHQSPPTVATPSSVLPEPMVKVRLRIPLAILLFSTTGPQAPGIPSGLIARAILMIWDWAVTNVPLRGTQIPGAITAFTTAHPTASLAGLITTPALPFTVGCTFPGTTSVVARTSTSVTPLTMV